MMLPFSFLSVIQLALMEVAAMLPDELEPAIWLLPVVAALDAQASSVCSRLGNSTIQAPSDSGRTW